MKRRILACFMALCLLIGVLPMQALTVSAAAATSVVTITAVDGYGNPLPDATVTVSRTYRTAGGNVRTLNVKLTNAGNGMYTFDTKQFATVTILHYTISASCDGYPSVTQQIDPDLRTVVLMLGDPVAEPEPEDEWATFDVYYIATGVTPVSFTAPGNYQDYGPSGDDTPLVRINVNVGKLKSKQFADCVVYEENNGNVYHFIPAGNITTSTENEKRELIEPFWNAVVQCMDQESIDAFEATGLFDSYMSYVLKDQGNANGPDYHCDGILTVDPPVYVTELYDDGTYYGGMVNDDNSPKYTTIDDVLAEYKKHLLHAHGNSVTDFWEYTDGYGRRGYCSTYVDGNWEYYVFVTQTNGSVATHKPPKSENGLLYQEINDQYYLAKFNAELIWERQIAFDIVYTDGLGDAVFTTQSTNHAGDEAMPSFYGNVDRHNYDFIGWTLQGGDGTVMTQEEILQRYPYVTCDMTFVAVYKLKPQTFAGTVEVILNGTYANGVAVGERVDITTVKQADADLYASADGQTFIKLDKTATGVYTAKLENGTYNLYYYDGQSYTLTGHGQQLDIYDAARTRYLFFNDVVYDLNGGVGGPAALVEYHRTGDAVNVSAAVPTKEGYEFLGWKDENGTLYAAGEVLSASINVHYLLTAQWKKINKAKVNVTVIVDGKSADGTEDTKLDREMTIELTYRPVGSAEDYVEVVGKSFTDKNGYYTGTTVGYVTTTEYTDLFTDLDIAYEYAANAFMSEYEVSLNGRTVTATTDANGDITYDVVIRMQYSPEMQMLEYTVVEDIDNDDLVPTAVDVKVMAFYNPAKYGFAVPDEKAWYPVTQHMDTTHDAYLDTPNTNGAWSGQESYIVWAWEDSEQNLPYYYRVGAAGVTLKDGTELTLVSTDDIHYSSLASANGLYPAGAYTAIVSVDDGKSPDGGARTGAYFTHGHDNQVGSIVITVYAHPYTVTFDPNGGTLNGTTSDTVLADQFIVPNTNAYVPTRTDAYVFGGWVLADANGNPTDQTVTVGEALTSDITLIAKWKAPKTIEGLVTVGATYEQVNEDGTVTIQPIYEEDRPTMAVVLLQRIAPNGYFETIASYTAELDYSNEEYYYLGKRAVGVNHYVFHNIPDDGSEYRVQLLLPNFVSMFQNEPDSIKNWNLYPSYTLDDYTVVWGTKDPQVGTVHIHNHFEPDLFELQYQVDVSEIGEGFRPDSVELLVTSDDHQTNVDPTTWLIISQMQVSEGVYKGDYVTLGADGVGNSSYPVWISSTDGVTYYQYGLLVQNIVSGGAESLYTTDLPYTITYQAPTHYHYGAQEDMLIAFLTPNTYAINYELNYGTMQGEYPTTHTWSHETALNLSDPVRKGYRFEGWYLDADFTTPAGDVIAADVAADTTLYAKWLQVMDTVELTVIVNHSQEGDNGLASNFNKALYAQLTYANRVSIHDDAREFEAMDGYNRTYAGGLWHTHGDRVQQDIFQILPFYTNLSSEYDYSANVTLDGYYVTNKTVEKVTRPDGSTLHKVVVTMQFNPALLMLDFYVRMGNGITSENMPSSAQVKVTSWMDEPSAEVDWQWFRITQHEASSVTVNIDPDTGIGHGQYPVWQWYDEAKRIPYHYRLEVTQLGFADGTHVHMNTLLKDEITAGNGYTATVETEGGSVPYIADANNTTKLEGVYGERGTDAYVQQGTLGAVVDLSRVVFHANNEAYDGNDVFRTYYYEKMPTMGNSDFVLNTDGTVPTFYDIPEYDYNTHNEYIFKGWYMSPDDDAEPFNWKATHSGDVHIYAHWIETGTVEKEEADSKQYSDLYQGYDLVGVQIREEENDPMDHYGTPFGGLRFVTVLKEDVYEQLNAITGAEAEYGYVMAKTSTADKYANGAEGYTLQYSGENVNGVDTTGTYKYVQNIKCNGVVDHYEGETYRLYTAVITYQGMSGAELQAAYDTAFTARSYIRYTDANGLERVYYNNYTGTNTYHGCSTSFTQVQGMMGE